MIKQVRHIYVRVFSSANIAQNQLFITIIGFGFTLNNLNKLGFAVTHFCCDVPYS